jgi:ketosteroid isomerase-like protein
MKQEAARIAEAYLQAWQRKDEADIAKFVHPQIEFVGPIAQTKGKDAFLASAQRMFSLLKEIKVHTIAG